MANQDFLNFSLLNAIIMEHNTENAEAFILQGAEINKSFYDIPGIPQGFTPLFCAINNNDKEMENLLLKYGVDIDKKVYIEETPMTALQYAAMRYSIEKLSQDIVNLL